MSRRNNIMLVVIVTVVLVVILAVAGRDTVSPGMAAQSEPPSVTASGSVRVIGLGTFREIAKAQMPMVVSIRTESRRQTRDLSEFFDNDLPERFFGFPDLPRQPRDQITQGAGTGFVIDKSGLILTNNHVVAPSTGSQALDDAAGRSQCRPRSDESAGVRDHVDPRSQRNLPVETRREVAKYIVRLMARRSYPS